MAPLFATKMNSPCSGDGSTAPLLAAWSGLPAGIECAERLTGDSVRHYVTPAMQHGLDYEAEALAAYEKVAPRGDKGTEFYRDRALLGQGRLLEKKGDKQAAREMTVFARRIQMQLESTRPD